MSTPRPLFFASAVFLALLAPRSFADEQTTFPARAAIPDASLRNVTDVVCVEFTKESPNRVPFYARGRDGFSLEGVLRKEDTRPLSRTDLGGAFEAYCFPAFERVELGPSGRADTEVYARVILDIRNGREVWLRKGAEDLPEAALVTIEKLGSLEAFEDRGVEFHALRGAEQPLVLRKEPRDGAAVVDRHLFETVVLGRRVGDYAEVLKYVPEGSGEGLGPSFAESPSQATPERLGWVRVVDSKGLLLIWPTFIDFEGC